MVMNESLTIVLKILLANSFVLLYKAQSYHWNCRGKRFSMAHKFFEEVYDELFEAIDIIAEQVKICGDLTPISLSKILSYSTIKEDDELPKSIDDMFSTYLTDNKSLIDNLNKIIDMSEESKKQGVLDMVVQRLRVHQKLDWMLSSHIEGTKDHETV